jgi:hypothetical protein
MEGNLEVINLNENNSSLLYDSVINILLPLIFVTIFILTWALCECRR